MLDAGLPAARVLRLEWGLALGATVTWTGECGGEGPLVNGVRHGRWIWRSADGDDVVETLYEEGERGDMRFLKMGGKDVR